MRIKGSKKRVKKAACFARALNIYDFTVEIKASKKPWSYISHKKGGRHIIRIAEGQTDHTETRILAHEMVHLKQHLTGDLRWKGYHYEWKGEKYFVPDELSDAYWLAPWEMEARALEDWLAHKWENRNSELH